jgi:serine/threonine-protein kinase
MHGLPNEDALHGIVLRALQRHADVRTPSASVKLRELEAYAASAQMVASPLRFGEWLTEHFGSDVVAARRARERALRAFEQGPVLKLEPIGVRGPDGVVRPMAPKSVPELPFVSQTESALSPNGESPIAEAPNVAAQVSAPLVAPSGAVALGAPKPRKGWLAIVAVIALAVGVVAWMLSR